MGREKITAAVLFGGCSTEYEVSLQSAVSVIKHLDEKKYNTVLIGITREGEWYLYQGDIAKIPSDTWKRDASCKKAVLSPSRNAKSLLVFENEMIQEIPIDAAFPVLHGRNGEDGTVQGALELAGIPVVGCDMLSSAVCMDKDMAHRLAESAGVKVPKSVVIIGEKTENELTELTKGMKFPLFVKPSRAGSSFGISKIRSVSELPFSVKLAMEHDEKVVIEEGVEGFEVGVAIIGNQELTCGEVDEIELFCDLFDYHEKYTQNYTKIHMPARLSKGIRDEIRETAVKVYRGLGCRGFARVDLFYTPEGEIVFNEVNTIPGLTAKSRFPNMLSGVGITYEELMDRLIGLALETGDNKNIFAEDLAS